MKANYEICFTNEDDTSSESIFLDNITFAEALQWATDNMNQKCWWGHPSGLKIITAANEDYDN